MKVVLLGMLLAAALTAHAQAPSFTNYIALDLPVGTEPIVAVFDTLNNRIYAVGSFGDSFSVGGLGVVSRGDQDGFVLALTDELQPLWLKQFGGPGRDVATCITTSNDGTVVVGGYCAANTLSLTTYTIGTVTYSGRGDADAVVMKLDRQGNVLWSRNDGGSGADAVRGIASDVNGGYFVTGTFTSVSRFDTVVVGLDNGLLHSYVQALQSHGNQRAVATFHSEQDVVASSITGSNIFSEQDAVVLPVLYSGSVQIGEYRLHRTPSSARPQTFVGLDPLSLEVRFVDSVIVCTDEESTWYGSHNGAYVTHPDLCATNETYATLVTAATAPYRFVNGAVELHAASFYTSPVLVGEFSGALELLSQARTDTLRCENQQRDGLVFIVSTNGAVTAIPLGASVQGMVSNVNATSQGIVVCGRAEGAIAAFANTTALDWDDQFIGFERSPLSSISQVEPPDLSMFSADQLFGVTDLSGRAVSERRMGIEEIRDLPSGCYLLDWEQGLSLCYVGSHSIAFPVSAVTAR